MLMIRHSLFRIEPVTTGSLALRFSTLMISYVWLINGLFCKCLNFVPRHQLIVSRILGETHAPSLTITIGLGEIAIAAWAWSRIESRLCCILQIILVMTMNVLEFILVPDLLLFGRWNIVLAAAFCFFVWFTEKQYQSKG